MPIEYYIHNVLSHYGHSKNVGGAPQDQSQSVDSIMQNFNVEKMKQNNQRQQVFLSNYINKYQGTAGQKLQTIVYANRDLAKEGVVEMNKKMIKIDFDVIKQKLINIASNSGEYNPKGTDLANQAQILQEVKDTLTRKIAEYYMALNQLLDQRFIQITDIEELIKLFNNITSYTTVNNSTNESKNNQQVISDFVEFNRQLSLLLGKLSEPVLQNALQETIKSSERFKGKQIKVEALGETKASPNGYRIRTSDINIDVQNKRGVLELRLMLSLKRLKKTHKSEQGYSYLVKLKKSSIGQVIQQGGFQRFGFNTRAFMNVYANVNRQTIGIEPGNERHKIVNVVSPAEAQNMYDAFNHAALSTAMSGTIALNSKDLASYLIVNDVVFSMMEILQSVYADIIDGGQSINGVKMTVKSNSLKKAQQSIVKNHHFRINSSRRKEGKILGASQQKIDHILAMERSKKISELILGKTFNLQLLIQIYPKLLNSRYFA